MRLHRWGNFTGNYKYDIVLASSFVKEAYNRVPRESLWNFCRKYQLYIEKCDAAMNRVGCYRKIMNVNNNMFASRMNAKSLAVFALAVNELVGKWEHSRDTLVSSPFNAAVMIGFDRVEGGKHNKEHLILLLILMQNIILSCYNEIQMT